MDSWGVTSQRRAKYSCLVLPSKPGQSPACSSQTSVSTNRYNPSIACRGAAYSWQAASRRLPLLMGASSRTGDRCLLLARRQLKSRPASVPTPSGLRRPHAGYLFVSFSKCLPRLSPLLHFREDSCEAVPGIRGSQAVLPWS